MTDLELEILEVLHRRSGQISRAELQRIFPDSETAILRLEQQGLIVFHQTTELEEQLWQAYLELRHLDGAGVSKGLVEGRGFGRRTEVYSYLRRKRHGRNDRRTTQG